VASRLRFVLAQLLPKPQAREQLALLLDADVVASVVQSTDGERWRLLDQRSWRTGVVAEPAPWQTAARAANLVTVWRSFVCGHRWLWVQWSPLTSDTDARAGLATASATTAGLANLRAEIVVVSSRDLDPPPVVAGADQVTAREDATTGPGPVRTLRCASGKHLLVLSASGDGWSWPEVVSLAEAQIAALGSLPPERTDKPARPSVI
jgi:transposase